MAAREVVVVSGARTAIGDYGAALKDVPATKLGSLAIAEAVDAGRHRPGHRRARRARQRRARRGARHVHLPRRGRRGGHPRGHALPHREPPVRLRPAGDRLGLAAHPPGRHRRGHRRRRREHEPRRLLPADRPLGPAHGRRPDHRRDGGRAHRSVRHGPHGHHGREPRRQARLHARGAGRVLARIAPPRRGRHRGGPLQDADRPGGAEEQEGPGDVRHRRARAQGPEARGSRQAAPGVQEGRLGHRRQRLGHQRRGRRRGPDGSRRRRQGAA